jgi:steroid delta-isomerase-like uncharacterized protein
MENTRIVEQAWRSMEAGDFDAFAALLHEDVEFRGMGMELHGPEAVRAMVEGYKAAFPDLHHEVHDAVEAGDTVAMELHVRGTHRGPMTTPQGELPATGREVLWVSADYLKLRDGKVVSWHAYTDQLAVLEQLGLMGAPATAG